MLRVVPMRAIPTHLFEYLCDDDRDALIALEAQLSVRLGFELAVQLAEASKTLAPVAWRLERIFFDNRVFREAWHSLTRKQLAQDLLLIGCDESGTHYGLVIQPGGTVLDGVYRWCPTSDSRTMAAESVKAWIKGGYKGRTQPSSGNRAAVSAPLKWFIRELTKMREAAERLLLKKTLRWLIVRRCSGTVPRFGPRAASVNSFLFGIYRVDAGDLQIDHLMGPDVVVRFREGSELVTRVIPLANIEPARLCVRHFWGEHDVQFRGPWRFLFGRVFGLPYMVYCAKAARARLSRRWVNRRPLAQENQLKVLQAISDAYVRDGKPVSCFAVMTELYGDGWSAHPNWETLHDKLKAFLDLLVDAGDLTKIDLNYTPTGVALKLIEASDREDRKHRSATRIQAAIALVGAAQLLTVLVQPATWEAIKKVWSTARTLVFGA